MDSSVRLKSTRSFARSNSANNTSAAWPGSCDYRWRLARHGRSQPCADAGRFCRCVSARRIGALLVRDVTFNRAGMEITIRRSKTDQAARGRAVFVARGRRSRCPVAALGSWLRKTKVTEGVTFRRISRYGTVLPHALRPAAVTTIVQRLADYAGRDARNYGGHSLRAGYVTAAALAGMPLHEIKNITGHKSSEVLAGYIRCADARARPSRVL